MPLAPRTCPRCQRPIPTGRRCSCTPPPPRRPPSPHGRRDWRNEAAAYLATHRDCECDGCPACLTALDSPRPCTRRSAHVDHLDGLGPEGPRGFDRTNYAARCHPCHSSKTTRHDGGLGHPRL